MGPPVAAEQTVPTMKTTVRGASGKSLAALAAGRGGENDDLHSMLVDVTSRWGTAAGGGADVGGVALGDAGVDAAFALGAVVGFAPAGGPGPAQPVSTTTVTAARYIGSRILISFPVLPLSGVPLERHQPEKRYGRVSTLLLSPPSESNAFAQLHDISPVGDLQRGLGVLLDQ